MAEFLAVVGSIGAIVNIIDATSKVISRMHDLHEEWNNADITVLSLASQLSAFRAALRRIQEWLESESPAAHHQLVMDLDETLSVCHILVDKIESASAGWESLLENPKATAVRRNVTFGNKDLDHILLLIERQTSVLTLLLTACSCNTITEQRHLLEKPRTRRIILKARADSASLFVHRDTDSIRSKLTDNLSKMSLVFDFDPALFSSYVYNRVFRGSLKVHLRRQQEEKNLRSLNNPDSDHTYDKANDTVGINAQDKAYRALPDSELPDSDCPDSNLPKISLKPPVLRDQDLTIVQSCEVEMLKNCYTFATRYNNRFDTTDTEHALPNLDKQVGQITRRDVQMHAIWQDPAFQALVDGRSRKPMLAMTLCRWFAHQMKLLADNRFQNQVALCLGIVTGDPLRLAAPSSLSGTRRWRGLKVYTTYNRMASQPEYSVLTVVIDVTLTESHYDICERRGIMEELAKLMQALMQDIRSNPPTMFSFILLVDCTNDFIERLPELCSPISSGKRTYCIDIILAGIVELVRKSNKIDSQCDYLTVWGDRWLRQLILVKMEGFWAR